MVKSMCIERHDFIRYRYHHLSLLKLFINLIHLMTSDEHLASLHILVARMIGFAPPN